MRVTYLILFSLVLCLPAIDIESTAEPLLQGDVSWIYDGDTLEVEGIGTVRLLGVDTPEKQGSDRDNFYQRWGIPPERLRQAARQATRFSINQAKCRTVTLQLDGSRYDRHGRLLAYVFLPDGQMLNRLLLEAGLATVYRRFDFKKKQTFLQVEEKARKQRRGLWDATGNQSP